MSSNAHSPQPPRAAAWLVALFTPPQETESILGDLLEEYSLTASRAGSSSARRWYWRQSILTIAHLAGSAFRTAPWTIGGIVIGAFLLRWGVSWLSDPAIREAIGSITGRYVNFDQDPHAYVFWLTRGMLMVRFLENALLGGLVAAAAKGREMAAAILLGLLGDLLAMQAGLLTVARTGDTGVLWTLPHTFAFSAAIILAAATVRIARIRRVAA